MLVRKLFFIGMCFVLSSAALAQTRRNESVHPAPAPFDVDENSLPAPRDNDLSNDPHELFGCGFALESDGQYGEAIEVYTDAIKLIRQIVANLPKDTNEPNTFVANLYLRRGWCRYQLQQSRKALQDFRQARTLDSDSAAVHKMLGATYVLQKRFAQAIAQFDEAIELDPEDAQSYAFRGMCLAHGGHIDKALADLEDAAELAPHDRELAKSIQELKRRRTVTGNLKPDHLRDAEVWLRFPELRLPLHPMWGGQPSEQLPEPEMVPTSNAPAHR